MGRGYWRNLFTLTVWIKGGREHGLSLIHISLTLNRGTDIWVAVYLEETKFKEIYLGQKAQFTLDAYDKLTFEGRVYYIGDNTASEFALVPPNNASGNFTKVTQRLSLIHIFGM